MMVREKYYLVGREAGGKSDCGIIWLLKGAEYDGSTSLCIRRNHSDLRQWIDRARQLWPHAKVTGKPAVFTFPNNSKVYTGHLKDKDAFSQFQGWNIDRLLLEELGQIPDEESYLKLVSSVRSTIPGMKPQIFTTANPGGPGSSWIRNYFKIGIKDPNVAFKDPHTGQYRVYIPSTVENNPTLMNSNPEYVKYLDSLPEPLRSAWRYGDWDCLSGQFFTEWDTRVHIKTIDEAKKLGYDKDYNNRFIGIDWGWSAPCCAIFLEVTPENTVFVYDELYVTETHPMEVGQLINKKIRERGEDITQSLIDPSAYISNPLSWKKEETKMYSDASIAHSMVGNKAYPLVPHLNPANNARVNGWTHLRQLMTYDENKPPRFYVIKGAAPNLVRTIPDMICDEKNPEDCNTNLEDHAIDALRYGICHIQAPEEPKLEPSKDYIRHQQSMESGQKAWTYEFTD